MVCDINPKANLYVSVIIFKINVQGVIVIGEKYQFKVVNLKAENLSQQGLFFMFS